MMFPYGDPGYMGWMMLGSIVFWTALVGLAIFAIVRFSSSRGGGDATTILKERLASGEITPEEYQARRALILGH